MGKPWEGEGAGEDTRWSNFIDSMEYKRAFDLIVVWNISFVC